MKPTGVGFVLAGIALLLWSGHLLAEDKNEARALFDRMEKKLAEAETIQLTLNGKLSVPGLAPNLKEEGIVKTTVLIARGNKVRVDYSVVARGQKEELTVVSDGTKQWSRFSGRDAQVQDTSQHLGADLVYTLSRIGLVSDLMQLHPEPRNNVIPKKNDVLVSDFRLGKTDKIAGKEVYVIHYQYGYKDEAQKVPTTLYLDLKTLLPVARDVPSRGNLREEYLYRLNEKGGEDRFALPR